MIILDRYKPEIRIDLSNGIYVFDNNSATGKTRLCKELKKNQKYGEKVASYSYDDFLLSIPIEQILVPDKYKVIMLDRYDMYNGAGSSLIPKCKANSIILIDCKRGLKFSEDYNFCFIEMTDKLIEVIE